MMLKFILVLFILVALSGCTSHRYFIMTPRAPAKSFQALNHDLSEQKTVYVIPDSAAQRQDWQALRDSVMELYTAASTPADTLPEFSPDWPVARPAFGQAMLVSDIFVTPDSVFFTASGSSAVTRSEWSDLRGVSFTKERHSVPLGLLRGLTVAPAGGAVLAASIVSGIVGADEDWTTEDWEVIGYSAIAGAGVGLIVGIVAGFTDPVTLTETTSIKLEAVPGSR